jgi:cobaltochelatase CobT
MRGAKMAYFKIIKDSIISSAKAISGCEDLNITFGTDASNLAAQFDDVSGKHFASKNIKLPPIGKLADLPTVRACADLAAIYFKSHNQQTNHNLAPQNEYLALFNAFEKMRLIAINSLDFKGIASNLEPFLQKSLQNVCKEGFLPFVFLRKLLAASSNALQNLQQKIDNSTGAIDQKLLEKIDDLIKFANRQQFFAQKTLEIIEFIQNNEEKKRQEEQKTKNSEQGGKGDESDVSQNAENVQQLNQQKEGVKKSARQEKLPTDLPQNLPGSLPEDFPEEPMETKDDAENNQQFLEQSLSGAAKIEFVKKYQIFTKKFDQIAKAADLTNKEELKNLRRQLDFKLEKLAKISPQAIAKLKRKLLAKRQIWQDLGQEEGVLDRKKISQIISAPQRGGHFLHNRQDDYQDIALTILLDNSGSMRGAPIATSAMAAQIIGKILSDFGIAVEILGFTTKNWRGGEARKMWESQGKSKNPGRISDLLHIIYKDAHQPFKKAQENLALMLKDGILKENIDGEALSWAALRLKKQNAKRQILLVISDGTPVDDATNSNNDADILVDHLHHNINMLQKHSKIEIAAIGIGHDVGNFYQNAIKINDAKELGDVMIGKICEVI